MSKYFDIKINGKKFRASSEDTILDVAKKNSLHIPTLCNHPDLKPNASCRLCLVEIIQPKAESQKSQVEVATACSTLALENMEVKLDTPKIKSARKLNLEMLLSDHIKKCGECNWRYDCELKKLAHEFGIKNSRFTERRRNFKVDARTPSILWDSSKCIECGNCVSTCEQITGLDIIKTEYRGSSIIFGPKGGKSFADTNCVFCGQCIIHCPSGSLQENPEFHKVEKLLGKKDKRKILIAQFAPSTRYSIGELFGLPPGKNLEGKLVTALKQIGFDYVFDINMGADITTVEEAAELIERLETKKDLPMITSCCPAWVKYVETFHHDLIPNLATTKSPTHCLASATKSYFAKKIKVDSKRIISVEIMPCVAKKFEANQPELRKAFDPEIDYSITVREIAKLLKLKEVDLLNLIENPFDSPLGQSSGAATIYGSSGGVMESALRTVAAKLSGSEMGKIDFLQVRGMKGIKEASVEIDGEVIEVAVVSGLKNAAKLIKDMKSGIKRYNYIEVMACPGGCLGGGGQPIPTTPDIRAMRSATFYTDDQGKELRKAHENKDLQKMYEDLEAKPLSKVAERLFHRRFRPRKPR